MTDKTGDRIRIGIVAGVLAVTGIVYAVLPFLAVGWMQNPFPGFFLDPNLVVNDSGSAAWPAKQPPHQVTYPDRITAVNDTPIHDQATFDALLSRQKTGSEITLLLEQPPENNLVTSAKESPRTVNIPLITFTFNDLANQFGLFYLTGLVMLIIGIWTFAVRPHAGEAQIFALSMTFAAVAVGALFDTWTTKMFIRLWVASLSLTSGFIVLLAVTFPHEARIIVRFSWLKWLVFVPGLLAGVWAEIVLYDAANPWIYAISWRYLFLWNGLGLMISYGIMAYRAVFSPSPTVRQQTRIILLGGLVAFAPITFFFIMAALGIDTSWYPQIFFIPMLVIYPLSIGYTIIRYRLLDVDVVLRRGLTYSLMAVLFVGAFALIVIGLTSTLGIALGLNNPILMAVFIVIIVIIFDPLRTRLQAGVDQVFFSQPMALDNLLQEYNRELTTAVETDQVADILLKYISTGIPDATPYLYLPDGQANCYRSYVNHNDTAVSTNASIIHYLQHTNGVLDLAETRTWPDALAENKEIISAMETAVLVPLNTGAELLGWISLSHKNGQQHYRQSELSYVNSLANQSLIGLERATVIQRLKNRMGEQDLLSKFIQALNFTTDLDILLELIYVNYQRLFNIEDFFIALRKKDNHQLYKIFHVEGDERLTEKEGPNHIVLDPDVGRVVQTSRLHIKQDDDGRTWLIAPLNAGASTIGALYTCFQDTAVTIPERQQKLFMVLADQSATALERVETNQRLQDHTQQLEIINQLNISLTSMQDLDSLLELILDKAMELLETEAGTFMITIPDTGELEFRVVRGPASQELLGSRLPLGTGLAGTAAQTGRPSLVNRVQDDDRWFADVDTDTEFHTHSILTVPLIRQNTVLGVLQIINKRDGAAFNEKDQQLLSAFAGQAVVAMENARLLEQTDQALQQSVDELFMLQQLDRDLNTTLDLNHILNITLDRMLTMTQAISGVIILLDEEGVPDQYVSRGYDDAFQLEPDMYNNGLISQVIGQQKPISVADVHKDPDYVVLNFRAQSQIGLPFMNKETLIGVIVLENDQLNSFAPELMETAVRITNHAAIAITNAILYQKVNEANQAKSEFVSMVSHELKTPMTSMRGYTDLMLSGMTGELNEQQRKFLETIAANIRRMGRQISDLTDISRIETGRLHMVIEPTAVVQIVNETLQTVQPLCRDKNIRLNLELPEDLPPVLADKNRLVQVLTNLLSNACKYSPPDTETTLSFSLTNATGPDEKNNKPMVLCSVKDQGFGISEEDQQKLFTKFFRSDDANIRQSPGTGLGLSITKGIIELQGGTIWVESALGQGTTFHFTIPIVGAG